MNNLQLGYEEHGYVDVEFSSAVLLTLNDTPFKLRLVIFLYLTNEMWE